MYTTRVDTDFAQEYYNESKEADCGADGDPAAKEPVTVGTGGGATANLKVNPVELALVDRRHGSMSARDRRRRARPADLHHRRPGVQRAGRQAVPEHRDRHVQGQRDRSARSAVTPRSSAASSARSFACGGGDCPEAANAALIAAGRLLGQGRSRGARDRRRQPPRRARRRRPWPSCTARGARLTTILSGAPTSRATRVRARSARAGPGARQRRRDAAGRPARRRELGEDVRRAERVHRRQLQLPARGQVRRRGRPPRRTPTRSPTPRSPPSSRPSPAWRRSPRRAGPR